MDMRVCASDVRFRDESGAAMPALIPRIYEYPPKGWDRRTRQNTGGPVPLLTILAGKCGFAGQPERRGHGSAAREIGNAIPVLT